MAGEGGDGTGGGEAADLVQRPVGQPAPGQRRIERLAQAGHRAAEIDPAALDRAHPRPQPVEPPYPP